MDEANEEGRDTQMVSSSHNVTRPPDSEVGRLGPETTDEGKGACQEEKADLEVEKGEEGEGEGRTIQQLGKEKMDARQGRHDDAVLQQGSVKRSRKERESRAKLDEGAEEGGGTKKDSSFEEDLLSLLKGKSGREYQDKFLLAARGSEGVAGTIYSPGLLQEFRDFLRTKTGVGGDVASPQAGRGNRGGGGGGAEGGE